MKRTVLVVGCAAVVMFVSWPLMADPAGIWTSARHGSDLSAAIFFQWWMGQVMVGDQSITSTDLLYHPAGLDMVPWVWNLVALGLTCWLQLLFEPIAAYNLSTIWVGLLNAGAFYLLGRRVGGDAGGVVAASIGGAFPLAWFELFEGRLEQGLVAPVALYVVALLDIDKPRGWLWVGLAMALVGATWWFAPPFVALCTLPLVRRDTWRALGKAAGVAVVVVLPLLLFVWGRATSVMSPVASKALLMQQANASTPLDLAGSGPTALPWLALAGLLAAAFFRDARKWLIAALICIVLAAGPWVQWDGEPVRVGGWAIGLPLYWLDQLPGFIRFWWPSRLVLYIGVMAAGAVAWLVARIPSRARWPVVLVVSTLVVVDGRRILRGAVADGEATIDASPLDPVRKGVFFSAEVPDWIREGGRTGAMIPFPLHLAPMTPAEPVLHHYVAYSGLPSLVGDAASAHDIRPAAFNERVANNPFLAAWDEGSVPQSTDGLDTLREQGLRWVTWNVPPADHASRPDWEREALRMSAILGEPVRVEDRLIVWDLQR